MTNSVFVLLILEFRRFELRPLSKTWALYTPEERMNLAEQFLNAGMEDKYKELARMHPGIFGNLTYAEADDFFALCDLMRIAVGLKAIADGEDVDALTLLVQNYHISIGGIYIEGSPSAIRYITFEYHLDKADKYRAWLERAAKMLADRDAILSKSWMQIKGTTLFYQADFPSSKKPLQDIAAEVLHQLVTLHLVDVAAVYEHTGSLPLQVAYSGASSAWLGLAEQFSGGYSVICKACGKPFVSFSHRRKQDFCSDACRKWKSKHPNEKRDYYYFQRNKRPYSWD